ncbi:rhoptry protein ROP18 [Besnoitia besnoiti]|uniref:Rhoptry protein ROP18 n=1 Tax=Besnoitia besnoiti TaxID=94643 RepID=A0A2A9M2M6_BESBE|nr:rhoptry protein ROP18 [Besnoitia besnoiti]PFH32738.1 rhoptry protein ROP18 [Besnoitia besnoiti]
MSVVLVLCHAHHGARLSKSRAFSAESHYPSLWPLLPSTAPDRSLEALYSTVNDSRRLREEAPTTGAWLEADAAEVPQAVGEPSQRRTFLDGLRRRLGLWGRRRGDAVAASEAPAAPRRSYGRRLRQQFHHARRWLGRAIPAFGSRVSRGLQSWWSRVRRGWRGSFRQRLPPDPQADPFYFRENEPADAIIRSALKRVSRQMDEQMNKSMLVYEYDDLLVGVGWPQDEVLTVVSESNEFERQLRRGEVLGCGATGFVFPVTDVKTQQTFVMKVLRYDRNPGDFEMEFQHEAHVTELFETIKDPKQAVALLRFMVPLDVVKISGRGSTLEGASGGSRELLANKFMLMPRAFSDLSPVIVSLAYPAIRTTEFAYHTRLQLTTHIIRLVANLHDQGVIHRDMKADNFLVMEDGRILLSDFGTLVRADLQRRKTLRMPTPAGGDWPSPEVRFEFAGDAMSIGIVLHNLWCYGSQIYITNSEGQRQVVFEQCFGMPEYLEGLIRGFLNPSRTERLIALEAMQTPAFQRLDEEVSRVWPLYENEETSENAAAVSAAGDGSLETQ